MFPYRDREAKKSKRLDGQHDLMMDILFGQLLHLCIPPVQGQSAIADAGTGTGSWLIDVARNFGQVSDKSIR